MEGDGAGDFGALFAGAAGGAIATAGRIDEGVAFAMSTAGGGGGAGADALAGAGEAGVDATTGGVGSAWTGAGGVENIRDAPTASNTAADVARATRTVLDAARASGASIASSAERRSIAFA